MGRRSKIESNPVILKAVNDAIQRGCTIDAIKDMLETMGCEISRSSVGVQTKKLGAMAKRSRDIRAAADAFASKFGDSSDHQGSLMIQLITTIITEKLVDLPQDDESTTGLELERLSSSVLKAISAKKMNGEARAQVRKEEREAAQKEAIEALSSMGASDEKMDALKAKFLGLRAK